MFSLKRRSIPRIIKVCLHSITCGLTKRPTSKRREAPLAAHEDTQLHGDPEKDEGLTVCSSVHASKEEVDALTPSPHVPDEVLDEAQDEVLSNSPGQVPEVYEKECSEVTLDKQDAPLIMKGIETTQNNGNMPESELPPERNNHLLSLQFDPRNLVIDSISPADFPHIVISPPDEPWGNYIAACENRIGPQWPCFLPVPPFHIGIETLPPPSVDANENTVCNVDCLDTKSGPTGQAATLHEIAPRRVFSPSQFHETIITRLQAQTRLLNDGYTELVMALSRRMYTNTVSTACSEASTFRNRWDSPDFVASVEKPFRWSDPAEPLLTMHSRFLGATIIDSPSPFRTPHIIIQEPPPANPWEIDMNRHVTPQDCAYGYYLTVPAFGVEYVNQPSTWDSNFVYHTLEAEAFTDDGKSPEQEAEKLVLFKFPSLGPITEGEVEDDPLDDEVNSDVRSEATEASSEFSIRTPDTTPDIVVQELPHDASVPLEDNRTLSPQDCGDGMCLTVPGPFVEYVNVAQGECLWDEATPELSEWSSGSSDGTDSGSLVSERLDSIEEEDEMEEEGAFDASKMAAGDTPYANEEDDDEDGLPPFDEWYLSIARRTQA